MTTLEKENLIHPWTSLFMGFSFMTICDGLKGEWSVAERTSFMEYLCNQRSYGGSKGSPRIVDGMPFSGNLFSPIKSLKQTNILQNGTLSSFIGYKPCRPL